MREGRAEWVEPRELAEERRRALESAMGDWSSAAAQSVKIGRAPKRMRARAGARWRAPKGGAAERQSMRLLGTGERQGRLSSKVAEAKVAKGPCIPERLRLAPERQKPIT